MLDPVLGSAHPDGVAIEPPILGRDAELGEALAVLDAGDHLVVLGEAGVGKSRLVREVARSLPGDHLVLGGGCMPLGADLPLLPVVEMLRALSRQDGGAQASVNFRPGTYRTTTSRQSGRSARRR